MESKCITSKCYYQSNLQTKTFTFHNTGLFPSKKGIILSKSLAWQQLFYSLIKAQVSSLVKLIMLRQNQFVNKMKILVDTTALKIQLIISQRLVE